MTGPGRRRLTAAASREAAIEAARGLLMRDGPQSVTLQAVAQALGMTHGNVAYHFGSSAALRGALVEAMIAPFIRQAPEMAERFREERITAEDVVTSVFSAFAEGGLGLLFAWMVAQDEVARLDTIFAALRATGEALRDGEPGGDPTFRGRGNSLPALVASALGAALVGARLEDAIGVPRGTIEAQVAAQLTELRQPPARKARRS